MCVLGPRQTSESDVIVSHADDTRDRQRSQQLNLLEYSKIFMNGYDYGGRRKE